MHQGPARLTCAGERGLIATADRKTLPMAKRKSRTTGATEVSDHKAVSSAERITRGIVKHIDAIATTCGATSVFVYVDLLDDAQRTVLEKLKH